MVMESSINIHDLDCFTLKSKEERPKPVYNTTGSYKYYKAGAFYNDVLKAPWSTVDVFDDVEEKLHALNVLSFLRYTRPARSD